MSILPVSPGNVLAVRAVFSVVASTLLFFLSASFVDPAFAQALPPLTAEKTEQTHWEQQFNWTIEKTANPTTLDLLRGSSSAVQYTVRLTKIAGPQRAWVDGQVCVTNTTSGLITISTINDELRFIPDQSNLDNYQVLATITVDLAGHATLAARERFCYPYRIDIPAANIRPGGIYKDVAEIHASQEGQSFIVIATFSAPLATQPTAVNGSVTVNDTNGQSWTFSESGQQTYSRTFTCDQDQGVHTNTATIVQTEQSSSATVTVTCRAPTATATPTATARQTPAPSATPSPSSTPATPTASPSPTPSPSGTPATPAASPTVTLTATSVAATATPSPTATVTPTPTPTATPPPTVTSSPTATTAPGGGGGDNESPTATAT
ncbi:MAG: hypothetical protein C4289_12540, partial [Chloroflexota bacterium]